MADTRKDMPLVSVIIPNFNYGKYLAKCIESILNQTYSNIEVILVDDGSSDDSLSVAKHYRKQIAVYSQDNQGVNAARNFGITKSKGDFIAICDSDDYWEPEKLELQVELIRNNPKIGLVYCSYFLVDENGTPVNQIHATKRGDIASLFISKPTQGLICGGGSTALFTRDSLKDSIFFDVTLRGNGEDWDFFRRLCQVTRVDYIEKPLVNIRKHERSRSARNLDTFYQGNKLSVLKAACDNFYSWNFFRRWRFFAQFEFLVFKSYLRLGKLNHATIHLFRMLIPIWLRDIRSQFSTLK